MQNPTLEADVLRAIATLYGNLGDWDQGVATHRQALSLYQHTQNLGNEALKHYPSITLQGEWN